MWFSFAQALADLPVASFDQPSFDQPSFDQPSFDQPSFDQHSLTMNSLVFIAGAVAVWIAGTKLSNYVDLFAD